MKKENKYLGNTRKNTYDFLIKKYETKLKGWKSKLLSQTGKTTLIKINYDIYSLLPYDDPSHPYTTIKMIFNSML